MRYTGDPKTKILLLACIGFLMGGRPAACVIGCVVSGVFQRDSERLKPVS